MFKCCGEAQRQFTHHYYTIYSFLLAYCLFHVNFNNCLFHYTDVNFNDLMGFSMYPYNSFNVSFLMYFHISEQVLFNINCSYIFLVELSHDCEVKPLCKFITDCIYSVEDYRLQKVAVNNRIRIEYWWLVLEIQNLKSKVGIS